MLQSLVDRLIEDIRSRYLTPALQLLKLRATAWYLEAVRGMRNIVVVICLIVFLITMTGAGLILIPIALLMFSPWDPMTKAIVGTAIGVVYLLVPVIVVTLLLDEKKWMRLTGAQALLDKC